MLSQAGSASFLAQKPFPWPRAWLPGHFTACGTDRPPVPSGLYGLGEARQIVFVGEKVVFRIKEKHGSLMLVCLCVHALCKSRMAFFGGSGWGVKGPAEVAPFPSYGPWEFQGAFPRNFLPGSFYPQLSTAMAQARLFCYPILGGACGPEAWATSVLNHDEVSGQEVLISHLLQDRLGFEKDFFTSLVVFILFF